MLKINAYKRLMLKVDKANSLFDLEWKFGGKYCRKRNKRKETLSPLQLILFQRIIEILVSISFDSFKTMFQRIIDIHSSVLTLDNFR